ncbi:MAG: hypothetical protein B7X50_09035, partial [Alishewanella sp. 34-51-39]
MKDDRLSDDEALELLGKFPGDEDEEDVIEGDDGSNFESDGDDDDLDPIETQEADSDSEEETEEET